MKASSRCLLYTLLLTAVLWAQAISAGLAASDQPAAKPAADGLTSASGQAS
jgi:hypothetical protein